MPNGQLSDDHCRAKTLQCEKRSKKFEVELNEVSFRLGVDETGVRSSE